MASASFLCFVYDQLKWLSYLPTVCNLHALEAYIIMHHQHSLTPWFISVVYVYADLYRTIRTYMERHGRHVDLSMDFGRKYSAAPVSNLPPSPSQYPGGACIYPSCRSVRQMAGRSDGQMVAQTDSRSVTQTVRRSVGRLVGRFGFQGGVFL